MFKRRREPDPAIETLIGPGARIEGNLEIAAGTHLDGRVKGNVSASAAGAAVAQLTISQQGVVEGTVTVPHVIVHGEVRGDIVASDRVQLGPTARVSGNVHYGLIEMAAGAQIQGRMVALGATAAPVAPAG